MEKFMLILLKIVYIFLLDYVSLRIDVRLISSEFTCVSMLVYCVCVGTIVLNPSLKSNKFDKQSFNLFENKYG